MAHDKHGHTFCLVSFSGRGDAGKKKRKKKQWLGLNDSQGFHSAGSEAMMRLAIVIVLG